MADNLLKKLVGRDAKDLVDQFRRLFVSKAAMTTALSTKLGTQDKAKSAETADSVAHALDVNGTPYDGSVAVSIKPVTAQDAGLMASADKVKLDSLAATITDTTENWETNNTVLGKNQIGVEVTTDSGIQAKIGDGSTPWNDLKYLGVKPEVLARIYNPDTKAWLRIPFEDVSISTSKPSEYTFWGRIYEG